MKEFKIFNSIGQKTTIEISNVRKEYIDVARLDAKYQGMELKNSMICYGGGYIKPFLRFMSTNNKFVDVILTDEIIEYIWNEIGSPLTGLLYNYTNNYRNNWCD